MNKDQKDIKKHAILGIWWKQGPRRVNSKYKIPKNVTGTERNSIEAMWLKQS